MKNVLIVVDYQVDFVSGSLGFPGAETLDEPIARRIEEYRNRGDEVIFTLDTHHEDYLETQEGKLLPVPHCIAGTHGHDLYGEVGKSRKDTDRCFEKQVFGSSELFEYLRDNEYGRIELCGLVLDVCVISNAILARTACPESEIVIDRRLSKTFDPEVEKSTYKVLSSLQVILLD